MKYWSEYSGHTVDIKGKIDNTIYTFDIESTSYLLLNNKVIPAVEYQNLNDLDQQKSESYSCMYIWQFGINDTVYYGRTWQEFVEFLNRLEENCNLKKIVFVHNLSFEFQFFKSVLKIKHVLARISRKVMTCDLEDYNIQFRCTLFMTNVKLAKLPDLYNLPVEKKVGYLSYDKIRHPKTPLTDKELEYCEYDCLVVYEYIKMELNQYKRIDKIPITSTGKVRKELQKLVLNDPYYRRIVGGAVNVKPSVYNMLVDAFAGGYTHANYMYTGDVIPNVDSYDETSAYPYVMVTEKFPMKKFEECNIKSAEEMLPEFAYLLRVKFYHIKSKFYNNFISRSKCINIKGGVYDNGRIMKAKEVEIIITDIDLKLFIDAYEMDGYEIIKSYYALYNYLPIKFINFILDKYVNKTQFKGVKGKELEYALEKGKFNSLYGMTVTNTIRDKVDYDNKAGWQETPLDDIRIFEGLLEQQQKSFLNFAWGVWVTAYARNNLLRRVMDLDEYAIYMDTDSIKLSEGYDKTVFEKYNQSVAEKIERVANQLGIPVEKYRPKDRKGIEHLLGVFECETEKGKVHTYDKFITQGAKKYCVEIDGELHITVSGVPKSGNQCLKRIEDFNDGLVFDYKYTNKNTLLYNDSQNPIDIVDLYGVKYKVTDISGCCLLPTTYELGKALEYADLLTDNSSARAKFKNEGFNHGR